MPGVTVDSYTGRVLGDRYRLLSPIGTGASATVYAADDQSLERRVAVKVLHQSLTGDERFAKRFRNEAKSVAQLAHPRILSVYDWAEDDECYLVTELLNGGSLRQMLDQGHRLSVSQALVVGLHALEGLGAAHEAGFVHRDIKPANLLFGSDGRLRIADFGIARAVAEAAWTEPEGSLIGTARYAAPEQGSGVTVTGAADIYSLALTLIEAVTGQVPLLGDSPISTMVLRQSSNVQVPAELGPLWEPLTAATRAKPAERPPADQLVRAFHRAASDLPRPYVLPLASVADNAPVELDYPEPTAAAPTGGSSVAEQSVSAGDDVIDLTPLANTPLHFADDDLAAVGLASGEHVQVDLADFDVDTRTLWPLGLLTVVVASVIAAIVSSQIFVDPVRPEVPLPAAVRGPAVGQYVGDELAVAADAIAAQGWALDVTRTRRAGTAAGTVLAQNPIAGNTWADGRTVTLLVSDGPPPIDVPELVGAVRADAVMALRRAGLVAGAVDAVYDEEVAKDTVMATDPRAGTELERKTMVALTVSAGPEPRVVPQVISLAPDAAAALLEPLGVGLEVVGDEFSVDVPEGAIVGQDPRPEGRVERGGTVAVIVSKGPPFVDVPRTQGMEVFRATEALQAAGLVVSGVQGAPNRPVLYTDPEPGRSVRVGTEVLIYTRR